MSEVRCGAYELHVAKKLAEGGFGLIYLVVDSHSGKEMVLKRCSINRQESYDIVKKEVAMLKRFAGPNVVQLVSSEVNTRSGSDALLLLELCPNGHLLERLQARNGELLSEGVANRIFGQILLGLKPMHEARPPVVHRDLKLENILFGPDNAVRICDFGSCVDGYVSLRDAAERSAAEEIISKETTQMYRSPEMIDLFMRPRLTEKTDIWALGCIYYALCFLTHPFQDAGSLGILGAKINMPATQTVSSESRTLITRMLDFDPEARPSIADLLQCLAAVAAGNALPAWEPSAEVLQRRQEREAAEKRRAEKNAKKAPAPAVTHRRVEAPLDSNSVAARRLAAKRGQPVGQPRATNNNNTDSTSFADFSSIEPAASATASFGTQGGASAESLFFSDSSDSAAFSTADGFDAFGLSNATRSASADGFDSSAFSSSTGLSASSAAGGFNSSASTYDAFEASSSQAQDGFGSSFSAFDGDGKASNSDGFAPSSDQGFATSTAFSSTGDAFATAPSSSSNFVNNLQDGAFDNQDAFGGSSSAFNTGGEDAFGSTGHFESNTNSSAFAAASEDGFEGFKEFGSLPPSDSNRSSLDRDHGEHEVSERLTVFADAPFETSFDSSFQAAQSQAPFETSFGAFGEADSNKQSFDAFGNSPLPQQSATADSFFDAPSSSSSSFAFDAEPASGAIEEEEDILGVFDKPTPKTPSRSSPQRQQLSPRLSVPESSSPSKAGRDDSINLIDSGPYETDLLGPPSSFSSSGSQGNQHLDLLESSNAVTSSFSSSSSNSYAPTLLDSHIISNAPTLQPRPSVAAPDQLLSLFDQPKPDPFSAMSQGQSISSMSPHSHLHQQQQMYRNPNAPPMPAMLMGMVQEYRALGIQSPPPNPFKGAIAGMGAMQPMQPMQPMGAMSAMGASAGLPSMGGGTGLGGTGAGPVSTAKLQPTRGLKYEPMGASKDPFDTLGSFK